MNESIEGRLSFVDETRAEETIRYLQNIGLDRDKYREDDVNYLRLDDIFIIEFKEKPFILKTLEYREFFKNENIIDINYINKYGISFYIASKDIGDGNIFVPMNNISCIHTIQKNQVNDYDCSGK